MISPWGVTEGNISGQVLGSCPMSWCLASLLKTAENTLTSCFWDLFRGLFSCRLVPRGNCSTCDSGVESGCIANREMGGIFLFSVSSSLSGAIYHQSVGPQDDELDKMGL